MQTDPESPRRHDPAGNRRLRGLASGLRDVSWGAVAPLAGRRRRRLARKLPRSFFALSLDCDTTEDIEVVGQVHERLRQAGVTPTYAVPGVLLERGAAVYRRLAESGAEFLNHGYHEHCHLDSATGSYVSSYFYDQLPWEAVVDDVRHGDAAVRAVLGVAPAGFRTPHFGTFSRRADLARLHGLLESLGYRYSSSTPPLFGLRHGPVVPVGRLWELPVSGRPFRPHRVLDSWSFRYAPGRRVGPKDFEHELGLLLQEAETVPAVVHVYADPSQIFDWAGFFTAVAGGAPMAVRSLGALLDEVTA